MALLNRIIQSSSSVENLEKFIQTSSIEIYDFFVSQTTESIAVNRSEIESYILPYNKIYKKLNFLEIKNRSFILSLLDISERLALPTEFEQLYLLCQKEEIEVNNRLKAASKFLVNVITPSDYVDRMSDIVNGLSESFIKGEDSESKVISTLVHYYIEVFNNCGRFNLLFVVQFREKFLFELSKAERKFLLTDELKEILNLSLVSIDFLYEQIHRKLDELLARSGSYLPFNLEPHLIETDTEYSKLIDSVAENFLEIRLVCSSLYSKIESNDIFWSLQRGVKVLTEESQLLAYIHCYGKMHHAKVVSAFNSLTKNDFENSIEIIDWGCGQGLASMCLLEYLENQSVGVQINSILLIEPSEIALKRAALHLRKFSTEAKISTLNKDLDSVITQDLETHSIEIKVHMFSNILDIDLFSMSDLISKIKRNFKGINYFLCVSPFINELKTQRLTDFVNAFRDMDRFEMIESITERKGEWEGTNWSRVIRVFKAEL